MIPELSRSEPILEPLGLWKPKCLTRLCDVEQSLGVQPHQRQPTVPNQFIRFRQLVHRNVRSVYRTTGQQTERARAAQQNMKPVRSIQGRTFAFCSSICCRCVSCPSVSLCQQLTLRRCSQADPSEHACLCLTVFRQSSRTISVSAGHLRDSREYDQSNLSPKR